MKLRRKKQEPVVDPEAVRLIKQDLDEATSEENIQQILAKIEADKKKREAWNRLSNTKKLKLLRYVAKRKGASRHGKK